MTWIGPYAIAELLDGMTTAGFPRPPEAGSVYVVSSAPWTGQPSPDCQPLYVGSNTGQSARFRTRMGDLIADLFGFFGGDTGHSSGGQSLHKHCLAKRIRPKDLYIGWLDGCPCHRCAENEWYARLKPPMNKKRPPQCGEHGA